MSFKKIVNKVHLWLGLATGLVVFIISITGCLYAFQEEIRDAFQDFRFATIQEGAPVLPPSTFRDIAQKRLPEYHLHAINYPGKDRNVEAIFFGFDPDHYFISFHDPYTGKTLRVKNMDKSFFRWVLNGHYYLWLPPKIGQPLTAYSTLIFLVMVISGIILWWPKNRSAAKQRFWFRWKKSTKWKRKNYDLHNILGFYSAWLAFILAFTGVIFGITWLREGVHKGMGGTKSTSYTEPHSDLAAQIAVDGDPMDRVWEIMKSEYPHAVSIEVHTVESDSAVVAANANNRAGVYWSTDYRYFDQYTLEEIPVDHVYGRLKDADFADKMLRMNYDIHIGAIFGIWGKILAFLISLTCASLPVTGFMIWWGRRKKEKVEVRKEIYRKESLATT
ncbi:PepSY domain-containing protein [Marinilongibacter aquaticus]|uniref:PepSY-associated TM helix domain-containing protein n=1 Tax=Marinilongibacter aquaticus TaxID=2975157 RepID=UPI0021BD7671|nr:PepSY-associated TM helix domain-containing protein [Marinilongibacter aquaticus]UBM60428.1 PepSY domain-containing protein [Marinilongibacter aquaticus]